MRSDLSISTSKTEVQREEKKEEKNKIGEHVCYVLRCEGCQRNANTDWIRLKYFPYFFFFFFQSSVTCMKGVFFVGYGRFRYCTIIITSMLREEKQKMRIFPGGILFAKCVRTCGELFEFSKSLELKKIFFSFCEKRCKIIFNPNLQKVSYMITNHQNCKFVQEFIFR